MVVASLDPLLTLRAADGSRLGEDRARLLAAIDAHGSIAGAARACGLSYKAAWDAVAAMNNLAAAPVVAGHAGGREGGGTALTAEGRRLLEVFRGLQIAMQRLARELDAPGGDDAPSFRLSWRLAMKTSARNLLHGRVAEIKEGPINAEVILDVAGGVRLVAIITRESVANLALAPGCEAFALIKSSFVLLAPEGEVGRISARNVIAGTVIRREDGPIAAEIVLDIGDGKTIAAVITRQSADQLAFQPGTRACAVIKASHIILAVA